MTTLVRLAGYQGDASVHSRALRELETHLRNVGFATEITPDITKMDRRAADLLSLTEQGGLEICYFSASYLNCCVPEVQLLDLPFLISNRAEAHAFLDGPLCAEILGMLEATSGYRVLGWWDNGFRHLTSATKAIRSPSDCAGRRIRTMGDAPQHERIFAAMGFAPMPLDVRELMPAVKSGTVDAQENPLTNIWNFKIHEYHRWITLTGHFLGSSLLLCNAEFFDRLAEYERAELSRAALTATAKQREYAAAEDALIMTRLGETDNEMITLTEPELAAFRQSVQSIVDEVLAGFPPNLTALLPL